MQSNRDILFPKVHFISCYDRMSFPVCHILKHRLKTPTFRKHSSKMRIISVSVMHHFTVISLKDARSLTLGALTCFYNHAFADLHSALQLIKLFTLYRSLLTKLWCETFNKREHVFWSVLKKEILVVFTFTARP